MPKFFESIFLKNFNKKIFCKSTDLSHLDNNSLIFYKIFKYFCITINSFDQLEDLKKLIRKLNKNEFSLLIKSVEKAMPREKEIIKNFLYLDFDKFKKKNNVKKFFFDLKIKRHRKRKIFSGKLKIKNLIFSMRFIKAFCMSSNLQWRNRYNPMPAIAIVGNDGSGKTTVTEYIRKNFSKMDPLIIDMKSSNPYFLTTLKLRSLLKKMKSNNLVKKISFINLMISFIGELTDLFDKYIKYKIGIAWADAGFGLTIFERYPTDKVRGEFPNNKHKLLPLEQFFPFPDGIIYLDVLPKKSILRKKKDNHTLDEMKSKRKNYLSLLKEFDEIKIIPQSNNIKNKIVKIKNYIFKIYQKKRARFKVKEHSRVKWKKNYRRILAGNNLDKSQKESFL
jgi:thymidylate kinase